MAISQIPFRMGDVVTFTGTYKHWQGEHIIYESKFDVIKQTKPEPVAAEYSRGDQVKVKWTDNRWYDAVYLKPSVKKPGCHLVKFEDGSNFAAELIKVSA